jgi:two-component system copper resistance phosphate regulon response regulator CusR
MRILLVEDEAKTTSFLRKGLTENGFEVEVARQGEEGLRRAMDEDFDLLVLDVMLPGRDGWSILQVLRQAGKRTPTLILTARDAIDDRVKGLELGADDYLVKPFAFSELLARIRSILRRTAESGGPEIVRIADLEVDIVRQRATRGGMRLDLTPKEMALLSLVARHKGEVLSRAFLAKQVWDMHLDGETNVVDVHIRRLRAKLDDPYSKKLIHTVRGVGYMLEDQV